MKHYKQAGFTIMELMVGMIALAIIAVAVGSMLVFGWIGWRRNVESLAMQRNAMIAVRVIEHGIRNAGTGGVSWDSSGISFAKADDTDFTTTEFTADSFVTVDSFNVSSNAAGGVDIDFTLSTVSKTDENTYTMTIYPRNE